MSKVVKVSKRNHAVCIQMPDKKPQWFPAGVLCRDLDIIPYLV